MAIKTPTRDDAREFLRRPEDDEFRFDPKAALAQPEASEVDAEQSDGPAPPAARGGRGRVASDGAAPEIDSVRMYLSKLGGTPLLSREREVEIAKRIEAARAAVDARVPRRREYVRESEYGRTIPPTIEELVKMNAPAPQIAMLHKMEIEDVEALLKAAGHVEAGSDPGETNLVRDTAAEVEKTSKQKK